MACDVCGGVAFRAEVVVVPGPRPRLVCNCQSIAHVPPRLGPPTRLPGAQSDRIQTRPCHAFGLWSALLSTGRPVPNIKSSSSRGRSRGLPSRITLFKRNIEEQRSVCIVPPCSTAVSDNSTFLRLRSARGKLKGSKTLLDNVLRDVWYEAEALVRTCSNTCFDCFAVLFHYTPATTTSLRRRGRYHQLEPSLRHEDASRIETLLARNQRPPWPTLNPVKPQDCTSPIPMDNPSRSAS